MGQVALLVNLLVRPFRGGGLGEEPIIFPCAAKMYLSPTVATILFSSGEGHHSPQSTPDDS